MLCGVIQQNGRDRVNFKSNTFEHTIYATANCEIKLNIHYTRDKWSKLPNVFSLNGVVDEQQLHSWFGNNIATH